MSAAYCLLRRALHYRFDSFAAGLAAAGYAVGADAPRRVRPGDVLVIWNRKGPHEIIADRFEAEGGIVLVAENGYIGADANGRQYFAIARHGHNGSGQWASHGPQRWDSLNVALKPWRTAGRHVLVCPNRSFGMRGFKMTPDWAQASAKTLARHTRRPVRIRPHPGNSQPPAVALAEDLRDAWAVVIWSSSCGVHALVEGIPVIRCAPWWIAAEAAGRDLAAIEAPPMPERLPAFERLAWAQWSLSEIASGAAFRCLLT